MHLPRYRMCICFPHLMKCCLDINFVLFFVLGICCCNFVLFFKWRGKLLLLYFLQYLKEVRPFFVKHFGISISRLKKTFLIYPGYSPLSCKVQHEFQRKWRRWKLMQSRQGGRQYNVSLSQSGTTLTQVSLLTRGPAANQP